MRADAIELGSELVRARRRDADHIARITADAFHDDPFNRWLFGDVRGMAGAFRTLARHIYTPHGFCYRLGDEGAAMWMLPGGKTGLPLRAIPEMLWTILARSQPGTWGRVGRTMRAMDAMHPRFPHAYLFTLGVRRAHQGKGLGRSLISPVLAACDKEGLPAYLENSNPANRGFYNSCGFERIGFVELESGAPPLEAMLRQPRA